MSPHMVDTKHSDHNVHPITSPSPDDRNRPESPQNVDEYNLQLILVETTDLTMTFI